MAEAKTDSRMIPALNVSVVDNSIVVAELQHRVKNLFAVIHALAVRSLSGDSSLEEARQAFIGRLDALARADQRLLSSTNSGANLRDLVHAELEPFASQVDVRGHDVILSPSAARNFALVLHELATNASKYGALSIPHGTAAARWSISTDHGGETLLFGWQEHGGPPVAIPSREGFGTFLLRAVLGEARFDYASDGFRLDARLPLSTITMPATRGDHESLTEPVQS